MVSRPRLKARCARRLSLQPLEARRVLAGVAIQSALTDGGTQLSLTYDIQDGAPFDVGFYRSADAAYGRDLLLDVITIQDPADLTPGVHVKTLPIGGAAGQVALPGAGAAETSADYYLLAVANPSTVASGTLAEALADDGVALLSGAYHAPAGHVLVQGTSVPDAISIDGSGRLQLNGTTISYSLSDVTGYRVRLHGGSDTLDATAFSKVVWASGGTGDDLFFGGTASDVFHGDQGEDQLTGGRGADQLNGGADGDLYFASGVSDGSDVFRDRGVSGTDRLLATAAGTRFRLASVFSAELTGIETIAANGFGNVAILGSSVANTYDLSGIVMTGVQWVDGSSGNDIVTGTGGDDSVSGGTGNDTIDGGVGSDTAVFAGNRATYSITTSGNVIEVVDLSPTAHGNDGTDNLWNIEFLRFRDGVVEILPNVAPVASDDAVGATEDGAALTVDVLANDTDANLGDALRVVSVDGADLLGSAAVAADGQSVVYTIGTAYQHLLPGESAMESFTYTIADSAGHEATAMVTVTIAGTNDAPVLAADSLTISEDAAPATINVLANDADADTNDVLQVVAVDGSGLTGTVAITADGRGVIYTVGHASQNLVDDQTATESFSYTVADREGTQTTATTTVTLTGVTDGLKAVPEGLLATEDAPIVIEMLSNDVNDTNPGDMYLDSVDTAGESGGLVLIIIYGVGVGRIIPGFPATKGSVEIAPDNGSLSYYPHDSLGDGETEVDFFRYTIEDSSGRTSRAAVSVTVVGINDAPLASDDQSTTTWNSAPLNIDVLANDDDPDTNDTRSVVRVDGTGLLGSVIVNADGTGVVYSVGTAFADLPFGETATETFTYTIADESGAESTATVTVTVTGANAEPVATADSTTLTEDSAEVTLDVLGNDSDPNSGAGDTIALVSVDSTGLQGSVAISASGNTILYDPGDVFQGLSAGESVVETFTYVIGDSLGLVSTATVTVTIAGANDAPVSADDAETVSEDAATVTISVLDNDTDIDVDDTREVVAVDGSGLVGSVVVSGGGTGVRYTVASSFQTLRTGQSATEVFTYTMADAEGALSTATVTLTIAGANEAVVFVNPPDPSADAIQGTAGDDVLSTTNAAESIYGLAGDDELAGNGGNDKLFGGSGTDDIDGGAGSDLVHGGSDRDDLTGGGGADTFRFYLVSDSTVSRFDRVKDFEAAEGDKIDLRPIDANYYDLAGNNEFNLVPALTGVSGQLTVSAVDDIWTVLGDVTGDGVADLKIEVRYGGILGADNFWL